MTTNEFERDLNDQSGLKRAGRVDLRVFQNTADAGDGHPGVQRAFRNYLHEGGMEKDLQLIGHGIKGTSVDLTNSKLQEFNHIYGTTISAAQWVYVGDMDQSVDKGNSPEFAGLTINGSIVITGNVDGRDISADLDQPVKQADSPTFGGLTINGNITITGTVDGVNVSVHTHGGAGQGGTVDHINLSNKGTNTHAQIDTHIGSTANPHTVTLDQAFDGGKIINGATSTANSVQIGDGTSYIKVYGNSTIAFIEGAGAGGMYIGTLANASLTFLTNSGPKWAINGAGDLLPNTGNSQDIGTAALDIAYLYYCNLSDTSCADFSHMSADELYQTFAQIKPRKDNIRHKTKDMDFKHIDFATLPDCFSTKADKDFTKENMWKKVRGKLVKTTHDYKKGDTVGIESTNYLHALKELAVKSYERIKNLEAEIKLLKGVD